MLLWETQDLGLSDQIMVASGIDSPSWWILLGAATSWRNSEVVQHGIYHVNDDRSRCVAQWGLCCKHEKMDACRVVVFSGVVVTLIASLAWHGQFIDHYPKDGLAK
jgi:hypothetical protein